MSTIKLQGVHCTVMIGGWGLTQIGARVVARSTDPGNWRLSNTAPGDDKAKWIFWWCRETDTTDAPPVLTLAGTNVVLRELTDEVSASQLWTLEDAEVDPQTQLPKSPCRIQNVEQSRFSLDISAIVGVDPVTPPQDADVFAKTNNPESDTQRWTIEDVN